MYRESNSNIAVLLYVTRVACRLEGRVEAKKNWFGWIFPRKPTFPLSQATQLFHTVQLNSYKIQKNTSNESKRD
jgi:hypothetical protein